MRTCWPSPGKLNLFLYITGRRADGYHELQTLFQFLDYGDDVTIIPRDDPKLHLLSELADVPADNNLLLRAARLLQGEAKRRRRPYGGADLAVLKRLPMGGGLGGGSSNAATVLVVLNQLWRCGFSQDELAELGLSLGADVPVFVRGRAAFAEGVGERLTAANPPEKFYLVACPGVAVNTGAIFNDTELPRATPARSLDCLLSAKFTNDCELIVRKRFPAVDRALGWLLEYAPSRLTGTGSCVFAAFSSQSAALNALAQAPQWLHGFVARGVNISPLWRAISGK